jgi:hypothetical protein
LSVPYHNPEELWGLPSDKFNEWRANNDLPLLLEYFLKKLPQFQLWLDTFDIDAKLFCKLVPTGQIFLGEGKKLFVMEPRDNEQFVFYRPWPISREWLLQKHFENNTIAPEHIEIEPYFYWAKKHLGRERYFKIINNNPSKTDTIISWSAYNIPHASRASIFGGYQVLKLGGINIGSDIRIGGRNLDFSDLDFLRVEGNWHGSWAAEINYASCKHMTFNAVSLHHFKLRYCYLNNFVCTKSELQLFEFIKCYGIEGVISESRLIKVSFSECELLSSHQTECILNRSQVA